MYVRGNPWGFPAHERTNWTDGLNIKFAGKDTNTDVLYFVACTSSYDLQTQKIAKNFSKIMKLAGVDFAILEKEICSGHDAKRMGESGLFAYLVEENQTMFREAGVTDVVTGAPHSFYNFTHEYPQDGKTINFQHSTQFINELLDKGALTLSSKVNKKFTYHDPCYLGRRSQVFDEPRKLIQRIPSITLVEMEKAKIDSDCCGMGGGRTWMEPPNGFVSSQELAESRIRQAMNTGADVIVTACPFCNITLNDAIKALEVEDSIEVVDITELIAMSL